MNEFKDDLLYTNDVLKNVAVKIDDSRGFSGITIAGDTYFGEWYVRHNAKKGKYHALSECGYGHSFEKVAPLLPSIDYNIVNFEAVLTDDINSPFSGSLKFILDASPIETIKELKRRNINAVMLANNHSMDFGENIAVKSGEMFIENGFKTIGLGKTIEEANRPLCLDCAGRRVILFNAYWFRKDRNEKYKHYATENHAGTACVTDSIFDSITKYREKYPDAFIIFSPHWGTDFNEPTDYMRKLASKAIIAGADCIIGHGSHIVSNVEFINGKFVIFSIGNFVFNHNGDLFITKNKPKYGCLAKLAINKESVKLKLYPFFVFNPECDFQPYPVTDEQLEEFIKHYPPIAFERINCDEFGYYLEVNLEPEGGRKQMDFNIYKERFYKTAIDFDSYCLFIKRIREEFGDSIDIHIFTSGKSLISHLVDFEALNKMRKRGKSPFSQNLRGVNIVLYDNKNQELIDSVCFDLLSGTVWRDKKEVAVIEYVNNKLLLKTIEEIDNFQKEKNIFMHQKFFEIIEKDVKNQEATFDVRRDFHKNIPRAKGRLRMKQLILLYILTVFDKICKRLEVPYSLEGGTLMGAWRNGGYIPWDDDVDVVTLPDGFIRLCEYSDSDEQFKDLPKVYAHINERVSNLGTGRFRIPEIGFAFDVFPYSYSDSGTVEDCLSLKKFRAAHRKEVVSKIGTDYNKDRQKFYTAVNDLFTRVEDKYNPRNTNAYLLGPLLCGVKCHVYPTDVIFPMSELNFEGFTFSAPNDPDQYLAIKYGKNYWELPPDINHQHHNFQNTTYTRIKKAVEGIKRIDAPFYKKYIEKEWEEYNNGNK